MFKTCTILVSAILAAFVSFSANATLSVLSSPPDPQKTGAPSAAVPAQRAAAAPVPEGAPEQSVENIQKEIEQDNASIKDAYEQLNQVNPFGKAGTAGAPGAQAPGSASALPPELTAQIGRVQSLLSQPWVQKYLKVLSDPDVQREMMALFNNPKRMNFFAWEAGWLIFMLLVKIWRTSKSRSFLSVVFTQIWTMALLFAGTLYIVPQVVFGPAYSELVSTLIRLLK